MKVVTSEEMREIDARAMREFGIPGLILMENAGIQVARTILKRFPDAMNRRVGIFAGKGNNGGDGFVVARHLRQVGIDVVVYLLGKAEAVQGDARINLDMALKSGLPVREAAGEEDFISLLPEIGGVGLVVDAIFGIGLSSPVGSFHGEVIKILNSLGRPIVAVDIPSGLSADSGRTLGEHIMADVTITMALPKVGHFLYPAAKYVGDLVIADICIPPSLTSDPSLKLNLLERLYVKGMLSPRDPAANKGDFGHVLVVAGSTGKSGAAVMAGCGALRAGAGLVTLAVPSAINPIIEGSLMEAMSEPLPSTPQGTLASSAMEDLPRLMERKNAIVIGPGLTTHPETVSVVHRLLETSRAPVVVDADGLNSLPSHLNLLERAQAPIILTPHPGEMARLTGLTIKEVQDDRIGVARQFAREHGVLVALKGARTVVADPDGNIFINPTGNAGMASGGTGDILAGMIGGFLAIGMEPLNALNAGIFIHGLAGDDAALEKGEASLIAGDILEALPSTMLKLVRD